MSQDGVVHYDRSALVELVKREAVRFGDFTLASGAKSNYYIDCRRVTLSSHGAALIGSGVLSLLDGNKVDSIGGLTLGADPIIAAVLTQAGLFHQTLRGFIVRKEAKTHGTGQAIEGPFRAGDRCVIVDDVATTGGSCFKAIEAVEAAGATVVQVVCVLDRLAGAAAAFADRGYPFESLLSLADLNLPTLPPGGN